MVVIGALKSDNKVILLEKAENSIGRSKENDVIIPVSIHNDILSNIILITHYTIIMTTYLIAYLNFKDSLLYLH